MRRKIIKRLSQEPAYALQISKELGLGQPLVTKHLAVMEEAGLVTPTSESSSSGPRRKRYSLARSITITMDLGPNMFMERGSAFDVSREGKNRPASELSSRMQEAILGGGDRRRFSLLSQVIEQVDSRMQEMDAERVDLLALRNRAMHEAAAFFAGLEPDKKRVMFHILDEHDRTAEGISESLNIRELVAKRILDELMNEFFM